ncbi:MAG: ATPase domain-containing protein [Candidatus Anstonellaceae archaeon]
MASSSKLKPTVQPIKRGKVVVPEQFQPTEAVQETPEGAVPSGIPGLDELMGGPLEEASTTIVLGGPGCGKTTFLCQFLYNGAVQYGDPGVLLSFEEPSSTIFKHMQNFGFDFVSLEQQNLFASISYRPHEVRKLVEEGGGLIWDTISSIGAKRLAIDSLTSYTMLFESAYQAREAQLLLFELLHKWKCTTLLSAEGKPSILEHGMSGMEYLADGVIVLHHPRHQSARYRAIEVLKMRGKRHSEKLCPFEFIEGKGIQIYPGETIFYELQEDG